MMEGWKEYRLGDLVDINTESIGRNYPFTEINYYDISSVKSGFVENIETILLSNAPSRAKRIVKDKDTILSTVRPRNRSFYYFREAKENDIASTGFAVLRPNQNKIDDRYLYYLVTDYNFTAFLASNEKGAAYPAVTTDVIERAKIHLPPLPIQRKIAKILSAYDDLIENNLKRIKLLEEMAHITYEEWFVRFKFPGHETTKFDKETGLPVGWRKGTLNDLIGFVSGYAFKSIDFQDRGVTIIKIKNIGNNTVDIFNTDFVSNEIEIDNKFILVEGDLIIAMTGATIGKVGFIPANNKKIYLNQRVGKFTPKGKVNNVIFVFAVFNSEIGIQQILNFASGAAQPNISGKEILSVKTIVPDEITLDLFSKKVTPMIKTTLKLYYQNQRLKEARDIILPRLMTGMIDVDKIEIEL